MIINNPLKIRTPLFQLNTTLLLDR